MTPVHRTMHRVALCAALLIGGALARLTSQVPVDLGKRTGRSPYAFGFIISVGELKDGRVIVADSKERAYRTVDFRSGEMPVLGEPGDDALQYRFAGAVLPWKADSMLLYSGNVATGAKYLHVSPTGQIVGETEAASAAPLTHPDHGGYSVGQPYLVDRDGSAYFLLELSDSMRTPYELGDIVRVSADGKERKVVDYLRERRKDQVFPLVDRTKVVLREFDFKDAWAIRGDGLAARVVADTYEVVWSRNGKEIGRTGPLPFTPIPITEAEQTAYRDSMIDRFNPKPAADGGKAPAPGNGGGGGVARMGGSGTPTTGDNTPRSFTPQSPTTTVRIPGFNPFPDRKPAIPDPRWQKVALFDAAGRLWVVRERAHGDEIPHVDVIAEGKGVIGHVNLPKNSHLAGFGANSVYVITHDDGGDWLERYAMPVLP